MSKILSAVICNIIDNSTVSAIVEKRAPHPLYQKIIKMNKKYLVSKEKDFVVEVGDSVVIQQSRPLSKRKKWKIVGKI